jgi:GT2 family glycosyltransferase
MPAVVDVRVGIVSWNTDALLDRCLAALPEALAGLEAEVVVVDNASDDASARVAAAHAGVRVVCNSSNLGYARAMNQALAGSDAPTLIALNPDTEPGPGTLATLVRRLEAQADVALVTPRLLNADGTEQHSVYRFPSVGVAAIVAFLPRRRQQRGVGRRWWLEGYSDHHRRTDIDWAIGAVHVLRAAAVAGGTPYSERWFMYVEDLDLCWRLAQSGWRRRLEGDVAVSHVGNAAGVQKWGSGRTARWLEATYDWYRGARGRPAMEGWALVNVAGIVWWIGRLGGRWLLRPAQRAEARGQARQLLGVLPVHLRVMARGPRAG